ncbi:MAG: DUF1127 domain-containing protein [Rhodobacter sp.]|nr:DUF1127 domain-containing protein [Rhodobacter sp.]MBK8439306.1 DUF1127 domain-containing protein [Rhodobacter sp.]
MFTRLFARMQLRRSTAFLLLRTDDRLLDDIGLTRTEMEALHLGLRPPAAIDATRPGWALPVLLRA